MAFAVDARNHTKYSTLCKSREEGRACPVETASNARRQRSSSAPFAFAMALMCSRARRFATEPDADPKKSATSVWREGARAETAARNATTTAEIEAKRNTARGQIKLARGCPSKDSRRTRDAGDLWTCLAISFHWKTSRTELRLPEEGPPRGARGRSVFLARCEGMRPVRRLGALTRCPWRPRWRRGARAARRWECWSSAES